MQLYVTSCLHIVINASDINDEMPPELPIESTLRELAESKPVEDPPEVPLDSFTEILSDSSANGDESESTSSSSDDVEAGNLSSVSYQVHIHHEVLSSLLFVICSF